jgi:hypothetical protein
VLTTGATAGDLVTVESFLVSSVLNAIPNTTGIINLGSTLISGTNSYQIDYLVVAGGGAGGWDVGGGGGAGGYLTASCPVFTNASYPVVIGSGGASPTTNTVYGGNGQNSSFGGFAIAIGGGAGGNWNSGNFYVNGLSGGSGGGGGGYTQTALPGYPAAGNQGNAGGPASSSSGTQSGGGGGGAGGIGGTSVTGSSTAFVSGGAGLTWYDGVTYAAGGKGSADGYSGYLPGGTNTGNGGDGQGAATTSTAGGSGIVIVRYIGSQRGTGGIVTSSGGYTYHKFTSSGTYTA